MKMHSGVFNARDLGSKKSPVDGSTQLKMGGTSLVLLLYWNRYWLWNIRNNTNMIHITGWFHWPIMFLITSPSLGIIFNKPKW